MSSESQSERRSCQMCDGRGLVGPREDRYVCPHCNQTGYCPAGCDWVGSGVGAHKPAPRRP